MRKILYGVIAAGFVATVGLSAQEPQSSAPGAGGAQRQAPAGQSSSVTKTVTLSGCIQNAPGASASANAAGASASASAAPKFILATKTATTGAGAAGGGAAVGTSGSATRYQLEGDEKAISPHLNHEVEITGTVQPSAGGGASAAGAGGSASAAGPMLKVESVKMVAATCS